MLKEINLCVKEMPASAFKISVVYFKVCKPLKKKKKKPNPQPKHCTCWSFSVELEAAIKRQFGTTVFDSN